MATQQICEAALEENEQQLSSLANVVGLGIVELDDSDSAELAVAIYVEKKIPVEELQAPDVAPKTILLKQGELFAEVPVRVIEQGAVSLE